MKINWKKHAPIALVQSAAASMTAGLRLRVHKTDGFPFEGTLTARLQQEEGDSAEQALVFDAEGNSCMEFSALCFGSFTLGVVREDGSAMPADARVRVYVDEEEQQGDTAVFALTLERPWAQVLIELSEDYGELTLHVMEEGAQGQSVPNASSRYRYEIAGPNGSRWEEFSAANDFEMTLRLSPGRYEIRPRSGSCRIYVNDVLTDGTLEMTSGHQRAAMIEQRTQEPSVRIRAFRCDGCGTLFPFVSGEIMAVLRGGEESIRLRLNKENGFSVSLYDLAQGVYSLSAMEIEGYDCIILTDGEADEGTIEVQDLPVSADILYTPIQRDPAGSLRVRKMIRTESGCLSEPDEGERFRVSVSGCGVTHTFLLNAENHFSVQLADLCPGCYRVSECEEDGYATSYELADGTVLIGGLIELDGSSGAEVIIVNEQRNNGKLQICKYVEDDQGCLVEPDGPCYAVRVHSFAFQETFMLNEQNDYCIALDQLPKGCYDIRESEGENVLYSVDQGEWSRSARVNIDDARMHEVRILNLNDPRTGTIRIEKLMENERCMLMQPERSEYFLICISGNGLRRTVTLNAANQWCVYIDELPYGEYRIEELYEDEVYYMVNGTREEEAVITLGREMQEVKVINVLPRGCALRLDVRMEDCEGRTVCPDDAFETTIIVQGESFCREVRLCADNRWQARLYGNCEERVSVRVKETMGYHILYECDGRRSESCTFTLQKESTVSVVHRYAHCQGSVCVEKRMEDECGNLCCPEGGAYPMVLYTDGMEVPFELNKENGYCVWFDDLSRGEHEIREKDMIPCAFIVDDRRQEDGRFRLGSRDVHMLVINPASRSSMLQIQARMRDEEGNVVLPCAAVRFALSGQGIHQMITLDEANGFSQCLDGLQPGSYTLIGADRRMYTCLIDGVPHEQARFVLDQEDVCVIMIEEPCACALTLCRRDQDENGERVLPPSGQREFVTVSDRQDSMRICLDGSADFCCTIHDLCPGKVTLQEESGQNSVLYVNGKRMEGKSFILEEGASYAELVRERCAAAGIRIDGMCMSEGEYHECTQEQIVLSIFGGSLKEQEIVLDAHNGWSALISPLQPGTYTICSKTQNVCFYLSNTQSCNRVQVSLGTRTISLSAVLQEQEDEAKMADFSIVTADAQGNPIPPQEKDVFTVRLVSRSYFETLVFSQGDDWHQQRAITAGMYEMYANAPAGYRFACTVVDGEKISGGKAKLASDSQVVFRFVRRAEENNVLYVQGCRRDTECDCLKQPLSQTVFNLRLLHADETRTLQLNEDNQWRIRLGDLQAGSYALRPAAGETYAFVVDGVPSQEAVFEMDGGAHHVKVIKEEQGNSGSLVLEAWSWDGTHKVKPQSGVSLWAEVSNGSMCWELLLDESNHWLASLAHLQPGVYQIHTDRENIWYQVDGQTPSQEGLAVIRDGEVQVDLLMAGAPLKKGSIHLRKYIRRGNELVRPQEGEYTFILSRPGFEERITLTSANGYHEDVTFLDAGTYVLDEQGDGQTTYRIDGGSEVHYAVVTISDGPVEVQAINPAQSSGGGTLTIRLEQADEPVRFLLQKSGAEYEVELSAENGWQRNLQGIEAGLYSLSAASDIPLLYDCDGHGPREHCTIRFADDDHDVIITAEQAASAASLKLQLWVEDERGNLHLPRNQEKVRVTLEGDQPRVIELSAAAGYARSLDDLAPGKASLRSSMPCMYRQDGMAEAREASFALPAGEAVQVDVIIKEDARRQPPTKLVL